MRMSTGESRDPELSVATIAAAAQAGITVFDTAHAYGRDEHDTGQNERLLAAALRRAGAERTARIVTKGGMTRTGDAWVPDGRAKAIRLDCEASLAALDGLPIDLYLVHAPDQRTPWPTSVRAVARLVNDGLVRRVGLSNVNRAQLEEALELAPISAVQVALSLLDDRALRGGIVERCAELGIAVIAHSPLGGPRRAGALSRREPLAAVARAHEASPAEVALAWLLDLSPAVVAIPGATRPETARSAARAAGLALTTEDRAALAEATPGYRPRAARSVPAGSQPSEEDGDVVLVMGIPGAGKTRVAQEYVARGYLRLNRDERGGALRELAVALDHELNAGARRVVLDNTFLSRAARSYVIESASRHQVPIRCVWLDTPLTQAQANLVERMLDATGSLPSPEELRALSRRSQGLMLPTSQMRALRELEPPAADEGFAAVEIVPFGRDAAPGRTKTGVFVAASALRRAGWERAVREADPNVPHLVFEWSPSGDDATLGADVAMLAGAVAGPVQGAVCPHGGGPPSCWCRPPLPGLPLAFARAHGLDPAQSILIGHSAAHRTLAATLGARYVEV
jgi:aryl-alcohol dehydrogenase-like predicted oxidoreductase